jgi:hypothetical protein
VATIHKVLTRHGLNILPSRKRGRRKPKRYDRRVPGERGQSAHSNCWIAKVVPPKIVRKDADNDQGAGRGTIMTEPELSEGETALRTVERDWNAAAQHWDAASLVKLYTDDALFYGGRPGHAVGRAKVRGYFDSYVGTLAAARLALVDQELRKLAEGVYLAQG